MKKKRAKSKEIKAASTSYLPTVVLLCSQNDL